MKKIILKYLLIYLPFIIGVSLYSFSIYNITSSLLFFLGGYIAIKNTLDYRKIRKNINTVNKSNIVDKKNIDSREIYIGVGIRKIKKHSKVRKRIKE